MEVRPDAVLFLIEANGFTARLSQDNRAVAFDPPLDAEHAELARGCDDALYLLLLARARLCQTCRRPVKADGKCWACLARVCTGCGWRPTGSVFQAYCRPCELEQPDEPHGTARPEPARQGGGETAGVATGVDRQDAAPRKGQRGQARPRAGKAKRPGHFAQDTDGGLFDGQY